MSNKYGLNSKEYTLLTGMDCNLRCTYCYEKNKDGKVNTSQNIIRYLDSQFKQDFEIDEINVKTVIFAFIGGEPLLHPDLIDEVSQHAISLVDKYHIKNYMISLTTNGTLFDSILVQKLCFKYNKHLNIGFSIDGTKEIHDKCRIDIHGNGSYDKAVEGFNWLRKNVPCVQTSVKATFNHSTIDKYGESVINLIKLGFKNIAANGVFEEIWTDDDTNILIPQYQNIIDYMFDNKLEDKINVFQINNEHLDMKNYTVNNFIDINRNFCGACKYMRACGFNNEVYGCQRFLTMKNRMPIGVMTDNGIEISDYGEKLINIVENEYKDWPEECNRCPIKWQCSSCAAIPFEVYPDDIENAAKKFFSRKGQCGFTKAIVSARMYFCDRLRDRMGLEPKYQSDEYPEFEIQ